MHAHIWWIAALVANANIAVVEYLNRTAGYPTFWDAVLRTGPFILVAQAGLYYCWRGAPSFMMAWAFFTVGNMVMRLLSNHYLVGERLTIVGYAGVALMLLAGQLIKMGSTHEIP